MLLARVAGTVVASRKEPRLDGLKFLLLEQIDVDGSATGGHVVAIDAVGAGVGEVVMYASGSSARQTEATHAPDIELGDGIYRSIDEAVAAARRAQPQYAEMGLGVRRTIVDSMRRSMLEHAESLAMLAHTETGLGRYEEARTRSRRTSSSRERLQDPRISNPRP